MGFNIPDSMRLLISDSMPARWATAGVKYLGISISKSYHQMTNDNILLVIKHIQESCARWELLKFSWLGRLAAVKMVLLPKLIFIFLNAVLDIPSKLLRKIQTILNNFILGGGCQKSKIKDDLSRKIFMEWRRCTSEYYNLL